jgi:hypothetical protein
MNGFESVYYLLRVALWVLQTHFPIYCPKPEFLSVIATITASFLSLLIPVTYYLVSTISQRHDSAVAVQLFMKSIRPRLLIGFIFIVVIGAVIMRFLDSESHAHWWQNIADVILSLFIGMIISVCRAVYRFVTFMSSWDTVIDRNLDGAINEIQRYIDRI